MIELKKGHFYMSFFYFFLSQKSRICYTEIRKSIKRMGELMSEGNEQTAARRQKRVQRLKKLIILSIILLLFVPVGLCVFLMIRLHRMDKNMEDLVARVEILTGETAAQQDMLQELLENVRTTGYGNSDENSSGRELQSYDAETLESTREAETVPVVHKVYLTFDDGPSVYTEEILDILDRYDVKATFFVVGKESDSAQELMVEIVERGHSLGMHSYSHKYSELYSSVEGFAEDFVKQRSYLEEVTGVTSNIYRFPGGSSNTVSRIDMQEFADYLESWDVQFYDWNVASGDGGSRLLSVDELVENSLEGIQDRETTIILMHDSAAKPTTVEALPQIIEGILAMDDTVILPITEDTEPIQHIPYTQRKQ